MIRVTPFIRVSEDHVGPYAIHQLGYVGGSAIHEPDEPKVRESHQVDAGPMQSENSHSLSQFSLSQRPFSIEVSGGEPRRVDVHSLDKELSHGSDDENFVIRMGEQEEVDAAVKQIQRMTPT
jgi:hypothetical protein